MPAGLQIALNPRAGLAISPETRYSEGPLGGDGVTNSPPVFTWRAAPSPAWPRGGHPSAQDKGDADLAVLKAPEDLKVAILAGGQGTRLAEETEIRPKPMVEIGGRPLLWHIMKGFLRDAFNRRFAHI